MGDVFVPHLVGDDVTRDEVVCKVTLPLQLFYFGKVPTYSD